MLEWITAIPAIAVAALVLFLPGLAVGWALALRGFALVAAAPLMSVGLAAMLAVVYGFAGVGWTPLSAVLGFAVIAGVLWVLRRVLRLRVARTSASGPRWALGLGLAGGAAVLLWSLCSYIGTPDALSQTNDAVFHLNAVRYAVDTGDASSLLINGVQGANGFYPAAWHAVVALVMQLGIELTVSVNAVALVLSCLAWPLGIAWLMLATTGSRLTAGLAAALSSAFATFPLLMLQWGVLYPLHASIAILPAAIALWAHTLRWGLPDDTGAATIAVRVGGMLRVVGLLGIAVAAIALAQPATLLPLFLAVLLIAAGRLIAGWRAASPRRRLVSLGLLLLGAVAVAAIWLVLSSLPSDGHWRPTAGRLHAGVEVLTIAYVGAPARWALAALVIAGLVTALIRADARWLIALWAAFAAQYVTATAIENPTVRSIMIGAWYEDPYRIAALSALAAAPLAAVGVEGVARVIGRIARTERAVPIVGSVCALAAAIATVAVVRPAFVDVVNEVGEEIPNPYREEADYLDEDERELLDALPELVEDDATVIGNPSTGMGFGYAFSGLDVVPRSWSPPGDFLDVLAERLPAAAEDSEVCSVLERYSADYVLDFGEGEQDSGRWVLWGFTDLDGRDGFKLVAEEGDAKLLRITACD